MHSDTTVLILIAIGYLLWVGSMAVGVVGDVTGLRPAAAPSSVVGGLGDAAGRPGSSGGRP